MPDFIFLADCLAAPGRGDAEDAEDIEDEEDAEDSKDAEGAVAGFAKLLGTVAGEPMVV